jgi:tRNA (guanine37-N1)-methyltransferase
MRFDIVTIFPDYFGGPLDYGIVRRAREAGLIEAHVHDLRDFTHDRHRTVDDRPFGGGEGMVMKPEPIFEAVGSLVGTDGSADGNAQGGFAPSGTAIVLLSAAGKVFRQEAARVLAKLDRIVLVCGRYEGVDERVAEHLATDEISIGDFVLSGGELPAAMILDAVTRLVPGALGNEDSSVNESFSESTREIDLVQEDRESRGRGKGGRGVCGGSALRIAGRGILDFPHYTRPQSFRGWTVPEVLMSGNHEEIRRWRAEKALEKTLRNRPDLLEQLPGRI